MRASLRPAALCWLRRPQPQTRRRKLSYDSACYDLKDVPHLACLYTSPGSCHLPTSRILKLQFVRPSPAKDYGT